MKKKYDASKKINTKVSIRYDEFLLIKKKYKNIANFLRDVLPSLGGDGPKITKSQVLKVFNRVEKLRAGLNWPEKYDVKYDYRAGWTIILSNGDEEVELKKNISSTSAYYFLAGIEQSMTHLMITVLSPSTILRKTKSTDIRPAGIDLTIGHISARGEL